MTALRPGDPYTRAGVRAPSGSTTADDGAYMLAPATRLLWRSPAAVHLELGSRAVVVEGLPGAVIAQLASRPTAPPPPRVVPDDDTRHALRTLAEAGYLWRRPAKATTDPGERPGRTRLTVDGYSDERLHIPSPALGPEFAALTARHGTGAAGVLAARRACTRATVRRESGERAPGRGAGGGRRRPRPLRHERRRRCCTMRCRAVRGRATRVAARPVALRSARSGQPPPPPTRTR